MSRLKSRFALVTACLLLAVAVASAHEARPAYLEIKETAPGQFSVLWRTPVLSGMRLPIVLKLPDDVKNVQEPNVQELADSLVERRWIDAGPNGSGGQAHRVSRSAIHHHRCARARRNARRQEVDDHRASVATLGGDCGIADLDWRGRHLHRRRASGIFFSAPTTCSSCLVCC